MAERQIEHRKSCLVLSARFPVVNWRSRPVAKSAYSLTDEALVMKGERNAVNTGFLQIFGSKIPDFFQTFSKTILYFSRLKVNK